MNQLKTKRMKECYKDLDTAKIYQDLEAIKILNWKPKVMFKDLCLMMLENDLKSFNLTLDEARKIAKKL